MAQFGGISGLGAPINYYGMIPDFRGEALQETQNQLGIAQLQQAKSQASIQQQQLQQMRSFQAELPGAINDPQKLQALAVKYPSQVGAIKDQLQFKSGQDVAAVSSATSDLQTAAQVGPEAVAQAIVKHAGTIQQKGATPQQLMQLYTSNPQQFGNFLNTIKLGAMSAKDQFTVQNDQQKNQLTQRGQDLVAQTAQRGQDIAIRGQDISASTTRRGQDMAMQRYKQTAGSAGARTVQLSDGRSVIVNGKLHGAGANAFYEGVDNDGNVVRVPANAIAGPSTSAANAQSFAMKKDLDALSGADEDNLAFLTGLTGGNGSPAIGADYRSRFTGKEQRQLYTAAQRVQGRMQNQGIAAARDMGASGINTVAEAKMYFQGMPQIDYSSPDALKTSIGDIRNYTDSYNQQYNVNIGSGRRITQAPSQGAASQPAANSGFQSLWGD